MSSLMCAAHVNRIDIMVPLQSITIQRTFTWLLGAITGRTLRREAHVSIWRWIGK
jgi:hypothetical protein